MKFHLFSISVILFCFALSCTNLSNYANDNPYKEPPEPESDSITKWLENPKNLGDSSYKAVFLNRFEQQKSRKQWDSAAYIITTFGNALNRLNQYDSFFLYQTLRFFNECKEKVSPRFFSSLAYNLGVQYHKGFADKQDSAIYYYKKTFNLEKDYYTLRNSANARAMLAWIYTSQGQLDSALTETEKALEVYEQLNDTQLISIGLITKYQLFNTLSAFNEADKVLDKAIHLAKLSKDTSNIFTSYANKTQNMLGRNPFIRANPSPADTATLVYPDSLFLLYRQWKSAPPYYKFLAYYYKVIRLSINGDHAKAKIYLDSCRVASEQSGYQMTQTTYLGLKAFCESYTPDAIIDVSEHDSLATTAFKNSDFVTAYDMNYALIDHAIRNKDYKAALKYTEAMYQCRDSIYNLHKQGQLFELERKYQTEKKERQILLQKEEIKNKNRLLALVSTSSLILILGVLLFALLQKQKQLKKEKQMSQEFSGQLLQNSETERKRIANDLHDSVSHELLNLKNELGGDIKNIREKLDKVIGEIRTISRNLHPVMFDKIGLKLSIEQLTERIQNTSELFISTEINYKNQLSTHQELQLYRIIQEALTNTVKYASAHAAKVSIISNPDTVIVEIKDNGKGFDLNQKLYNSKSFGLYSILERSKVIGGSAEINPSDKGTIITVTIPVS